LIILVDAMGGDNAPDEIVRGCVEALNERDDFDLVLYGIEHILRAKLLDYNYPEHRISVVNTTEIINGHDFPVKAVKEKNDSSLIVALMDLRHKRGDVLVTAGNTGAVMAGALFKLGRVKGIARPALSSLIPTKKGMKMFLDVGANTVCKPENYLDFGIMGSIYMENIFGIKNPTVGLLNIGSEETKGTDNLKTAYNLLHESGLNFIGNIEGKDIISGNIDVVVTDGFTGNVLLKFLEGIGEFIFSELSNIFKFNIFTKLSALIIKTSLRKFKKKLDYAEYGGVPLLGVNGKVLKAHGGSNAKAIKNLIFIGYRYAKSSVLQDIKEKYEKMEVNIIG
jgi:phosphate acyltransferase